MSTEIFYFSGSGNSLHVARELQKRLDGTTLVPIASLSNQTKVETQGETLGFIFPQHASQMPVIVAELLPKMDMASVRYIFAIVTRGGTPCRVFPELERLLKNGGKRLDAGFVLTMPGSTESLIKNFAEKINAERVDRLEAGMLQRLGQIEKIIKNRENHPPQDLNGEEIPALFSLFEPIILPLARMAEGSFDFYADANCTGCGICEKVCLGRKIDLVDEKPVWMEQMKCVNCFACLNYCPEEAVQIKSTWYLKSYTPQNGRYHHPQVSAGDIAAQKQPNP